MDVKGTAYITFDEVLVPFENTLGEDGNGLQVILRCVFCAEGVT
jgi:alkylation response protein AidB-like acyl-CoA dehydrogenase